MRTIFTIGHSTHPIEKFIALLKAHAIEALIDIRTMPRSRHNPQFNGEALAKSLASEAIQYRWIKNLGGLRKPRRDSPNQGWKNESFRGYADYMQTDSFTQALEDIIILNKKENLVLMCAEAVPWRCHRSLVADALTVRGLSVEHILSEINTMPHQLTRFAQVEGITIMYPFHLS